MKKVIILGQGTTGKKLAEQCAIQNVVSSFYSDGIDHSSLKVNSDEYPEHDTCVACGSESVTITPDKDICHDCGFVYE